jgi:hypothetical protein
MPEGSMAIKPMSYTLAIEQSNSNSGWQNKYMEISVYFTFFFKFILRYATNNRSKLRTSCVDNTECKFNAAEDAVLVKECFPNIDIFLQMKEKDISNIGDDNL